MFWLFCYDICDNRVRQKVSKYLSQHGMRIQKSVFGIDCDEIKIMKILNTIDAICKHNGILSIYPLYDGSLDKILYLGCQNRITKFNQFILI